jgi:hypothetical protein
MVWLLLIRRLGLQVNRLQGSEVQNGTSRNARVSFKKKCTIQIPDKRVPLWEYFQ